MTFSLKKGSPQEASQSPIRNIAHTSIFIIGITLQLLKDHAWFSPYPIGVQIGTVLAF